MLTPAMRQKVAELRAMGVLPVYNLGTGEVVILEAQFVVTSRDAQGHMKTVDLYRHPVGMPTVPELEPAVVKQIVAAQGGVL